MSRIETTRPTSFAWCALLASACLGRAVHLNDGLFHRPAFPWLALACLFAALPFALPARFRDRTTGERAFVAAAAVLLAASFASLFRSRLLSAITYDAIGPAPAYVRGLLLVAAAASLAVVVNFRPKTFFAVAVAAAAGVGVYALVATPRPHIDVWDFQQEGVAALFRGESPYAAKTPDLYGDVDLYGPGRVRDGRISIGFQYPPVVLLVDVVGKFVAGDYRFAQLAAWLSASVLLAAIGGRRARVAALTLLFWPRAFFLLEQGWPEPTQALLLAATALAAKRRPAALPWIAGLLLASRQYLVVAAPLLLFLADAPRSPRATLAFLLKAAAIGAAVTLPFLLWDPEAFAESLWVAQTDMPPRRDALSFLALIADGNGGVFPPTWIGFVVGVGAVSATFVRGPRRPALFGAALGASLLYFFAFNKFAFCNYYATVLAAFATIVARDDGPSSDGATTSLT
jgi:hypothetical protein